MLNSVLSNYAQVLLKQGYGYRDDTVYGTYIQDPVSIINYETMELGNKDIYCTLSNVYGIHLDKRKKPKTLNDYIFNYLKCLTKQDLHVLKAIWLCAFETDVKSQYGGNNISRVRFVKPCVILSDLGKDGVLILTSSIEYID